MDVEKVIIELLKSTDRKGMALLIAWLETSWANEDGFFESPASTKFHGCHKGGLAKHSFDVYVMLMDYDVRLNLGTPIEALIIAPLLHDICKVGAYHYSDNHQKYIYNKSQPKGHATLSLERIKKFIELTELEEKMIRYHMGVYGLVEFDEGKGEYRLRDKGMANAWYHHPVVKVMYFCDELVTLREKREES